VLEKVPDSSSLPLPEHAHPSFYIAKEVSNTQMMLARLVMHKIIIYLYIYKENRFTAMTVPSRT